MFPQQPQQQFRTTNANVQFFYGTGTAGAAGQGGAVWNKPPGCSQIYMMLIGGGGTNASGSGGGSGAVTTWWGAAQNVPDILNITVSPGNAVDTRVQYRGSNGLNILLSAAAGSANTGASAMTANQFTASGLFQSVGGQNGNNTGISPSNTTFLGGGNGGASLTANYGYSVTENAGFFQLQPVIFGAGGATSSGTAYPGGIGCGGSKNSGVGGPGLVIIAAW